MVLFTNNDHHVSETECKHCKNTVMETINADHPHGISALNEGYDYMCCNCGKLVSKGMDKHE